MSETRPAAGAVKGRLLSLYESSSPQLFTQLLVDYDVARQKITTESTKIYDLRAAARLQILFADGFKKEAAIQFLEAAIRHLRDSGLPTIEEPALYPDHNFPARPVNDPPQPHAELPPASASDGASSWESVLATLHSHADRRGGPAPPVSVAPPVSALPRQAPDIKSREGSVSTFPTLERYQSPLRLTSKRERVRGLIPSLLSIFNGY